MKDIFEPTDSEKKTLSGGKMKIRMDQRIRPKTPPILKSSNGSGISYKSSTVVTKQRIAGVRANRNRKVTIRRVERSFGSEASLALRNNSTVNMSFNNPHNLSKESTRRDKLMNMVQKITVKIDEEEQESLSGKFKFKNKDLGNCFVILNDNKSHLMGVFAADDYNERLAYNFLEEIEILLISFEE
jgi:hypothetical protein